METCSVVLTFESVVEILWCDHSNETFSVVLLHGTIWFSTFYKIAFRVFLEFCSLALLEVKGLMLIHWRVFYPVDSVIHHLNN